MSQRELAGLEEMFGMTRRPKAGGGTLTYELRVGLANDRTLMVILQGEPQDKADLDSLYGLITRYSHGVMQEAHSDGPRLVVDREGNDAQ